VGSSPTRRANFFSFFINVKTCGLLSLFSQLVGLGRRGGLWWGNVCFVYNKFFLTMRNGITASFIMALAFAHEMTKITLYVFL
jgi:hypothetical protein